MLKINMEFRKGILFVRLKGVLDQDTLDYFKKEVSSFIEENGLKYIVINVEQLQAIDSYGLHQFTKDYEKISSEKGMVVLCGIEKKSYQKDLEYIYRSPNELYALKQIQI